MYGFSVLSFSEKPHAVTASAYSEASRPHKRYQVHLNTQHIPHTFTPFLCQTTARHHHFYTGWQSCQKPNSPFTLMPTNLLTFSPPKKHDTTNHSPGYLGSRHISSKLPLHYLRLPSTLSQTTWQVISTPISLAYPDQVFTAFRERFLIMHLIDFPSMTHIYP